MNIKPEIFFIEIFVGMGKIVSWWHEYALGFELKGKRESIGQKGRQLTYWLQLGECNLLITSALEPSATDIVSFVDRHGNSIKSFAVEIDDINAVYLELKEKKAIMLNKEIEWLEINGEKSGTIRCKLFDDNEINFIQRINCKNILPGFAETSEKTDKEVVLPKGNVLRFDHLASVVRTNEANFWNEYLIRIFSLKEIYTVGEEFFAGLSTGMQMHVLASENGRFNKVIVEPLLEKEKKSQVDIFIQHHLGNGIQHIAFEVDDLTAIISGFKERGVKFTTIPEKYYVDLAKEHPELPVEELKKANILCEIYGSKLLLQVFTEPIGDRPTLFYEFIQRINSFSGFGTNNIKQLFKSLEAQLNG